jgi:phenylalanyl-tRNA synthetase beta subunit
MSATLFVGPSDLLICDAERPIGIAGVMGLANSEIRSDSRTIVLEAATFRAEQVRRTALALSVGNMNGVWRGGGLGGAGRT